MAAALRIIITSDRPPRYDNSPRDFAHRNCRQLIDRSRPAEIDRASDAYVNAGWARFASDFEKILSD